MFGKKIKTAADAPAKPTPAVAAKPPPKTPKTPSKGKQAYEGRRAEKAGVALEKWMAEKERRVQAERDAARRTRAKAAPPGKPGLLRRLLDKAHRPL